MGKKHISFDHLTKWETILETFEIDYSIRILELFEVGPPKVNPWPTRTLVDTSVVDSGGCRQQFLLSKREHFPLLGKALEAFKV